MEGLRPWKSNVAAALIVIGTATVLDVSVRLARFCWRHFLRPNTNLAIRYGKGTWAIVTGATSGIGREFTMELAKQGFNVVIIARTKENLQQLSKELEKTFKVKTYAFPMDASTATETQLQSLIHYMKEKKVSILINAVGIHNRVPCNVDKMTSKEMEQIIRVNCMFTVLLTSKIIPLLEANTQSKRSAIINVGSLTSTSPMAMLSTYAGSKAFIQHWSRCLAAELSPYNIDVLCVKPGLMATPMSGIKTSSFAVADARVLAIKALGMIGIGSKTVLPHWPHELMYYLGSILPESLQDSIARDMGLEKLKEADADDVSKEE